LCADEHKKVLTLKFKSENTPVFFTFGYGKHGNFQMKNIPAVLSACALLLSGAFLTMGAQAAPTDPVKQDSFQKCQPHAYGLSGDGRFPYSLSRMTGEDSTAMVIYDIENRTRKKVRFQGGGRKSAQPLQNQINDDFKTGAPISGTEIVMSRGTSAMVFSLSERRVVREIDYPFPGMMRRIGQPYFNGDIFLFPAPMVHMAYQKINLATGETEKFESDGRSPAGWFFDGKGEFVLRFFAAKEDPLAETWEYQWQKDKWKQIELADRKGSTVRLIQEQLAPGETRPALWLLRRADLKNYTLLRFDYDEEKFELVARFDDPVKNVQMGPRNKKLLWVELQGEDGLFHSVFFDEKWQRVYKKYVTPSQSFQILKWSFDGQVFVGMTEDIFAQREVFVAQVEGQDFSKQLVFCKDEEKANLPLPVVMNLTASDGLEIPAYQFGPDAPEKGYILWVHGGPQARTWPVYNKMRAELAAAGYTLLFVDYRGSAGYGAGFVTAANGAYEAMIGDVMLGKAYIDGFNDKDLPVFIFGDSFGAMLAGSVLFAHPQAGFSGYVSIAGLFDLTASDFYKYVSRQNIIGLFGAGVDYENLPQSVLDLILFYHPESMTIPSLIIHGKLDHRVSYQHTVKFSRAVRAHGVMSKLVLLEKGGHGIDCAGCREQVYEQIKIFLGETGRID
jgi:dipeptidyl aminopeptidase/acylaminoacyl peptidase